MSLIVEANASGANADGVAVERQHVVAARRTITEHKDLASAFGAQVDEVVARAAQKAGEVEVARLERDLVHHSTFCLSVQWTLYVFLKKRGYGSTVSDACCGACRSSSPSFSSRRRIA